MARAAAGSGPKAKQKKLAADDCGAPVKRVSESELLAATLATVTAHGEVAAKETKKKQAKAKAKATLADKVATAPATGGAAAKKRSKKRKEAGSKATAPAALPASHKRQKVAKTLTPLHQPTRAPPTGAGVALQQPNRPVPRLTLEPAAPVHKDLLPLSAAAPEPALEVSRLRALTALRIHLEKACRAAAGSPAPSYAFERWHSRALHREASLPPAAASDPLVPSLPWEDAELAADLERVGVTPASAAAIARSLAAASTTAAQSLHARAHIVTGAVAVETHRHTLDVTLQGERLLLKGETG